MKSLLAQLQNNEAILLMYVMDELPPEDRMEVEQMLQTDENLRRELARLVEAERAVHGALQRADELQPLSIPVPSLQRQVSRLYTHWQVEKLSESAPVVVENGRRHWTTWAIPAATAAAILIGVLIWAGLRDNASNLGNEFDTDFGSMNRYASAAEVHYALIRSFDNPDDLRDEESQLQAIADRREDLSPLLSLEGSFR